MRGILVLLMLTNTLLADGGADPDVQHYWTFVERAGDNQTWAWTMKVDEPVSINWVTLNLMWSTQWDGGYVAAWSPYFAWTDGWMQTDKGTHINGVQHFGIDSVEFEPGIYELAYVTLSVGAAYGMGYTDGGSVGGDDVYWINDALNDGELLPVEYTCPNIDDFWEHVPSTMVEERYDVHADINKDGWVDFRDRGHVNVALDGWCSGDTNADYQVDLADVGIVLGAYGTEYGDPAYTIGADLNGDGSVTMDDLGLVLAHYGEGLD
jgi:hypothetical protein